MSHLYLRRCYLLRTGIVAGSRIDFWTAEGLSTSAIHRHVLEVNLHATKSPSLASELKHCDWRYLHYQLLGYLAIGRNRRAWPDLHNAAPSDAQRLAAASDPDHDSRVCQWNYSVYISAAEAWTRQ